MVVRTNNPDINELYRNREMDLGKALEKAGVKNKHINNPSMVGKTIRVGKTAVELLPYVGDVYDIGRGTYQAFHGHPFVGTGQALLGGAGLAANMLFPGTGTVGKTAVKVGAKGLVKGGAKIGRELVKEAPELANAIKNYAKMNRSIGSQVGTTIAPEVLYKMFGNDEDVDTTKPVTALEEVDIQDQPIQPTNNIQQYTGGGYVPDSIEQLLNNIPADQRYVSPEEQHIDIQAATADGIQGSNDTSSLLDYYNKQIELLKPYQEGLKSLIDNYGDYQRQAFNKDRYLAGLAGWSGNKAFENMIGKYNPAEIEATRLDLLNKLARSEIAEAQGANNILGTVEMMQRAGLPANMALVDPAMIGKLSNVLSAQTAAEARKYVADQNYKAKVLDTQLDNAIKYYSKVGDWNTALKLQGMKSQNRLQSTYLQQLPWVTDYGMLNEAMKQFGYPINIQPTQQQGTTQPITANDLFR